MSPTTTQFDVSMREARPHSENNLQLHLESLNHFYSTAYHTIQQNFVYEQQAQRLISDNQTFLSMLQDKDLALEQCQNQCHEEAIARERLEWDLKEHITLLRSAEEQTAARTASAAEVEVFKQKAKEADERYSKLFATHRKMLAHCAVENLQLPHDLDGLPSPEAGMINVLKALHEVNEGMHSTITLQERELKRNGERIEFLEHWTGVDTDLADDTEVGTKRARSASPPRKTLKSRPTLRLRIKEESTSLR